MWPFKQITRSVADMTQSVVNHQNRTANIITQGFDKAINAADAG
jgi:hypothetical protein